MGSKKTKRMVVVQIAFGLKQFFVGIKVRVTGVFLFIIKWQDIL